MKNSIIWLAVLCICQLSFAQTKPSSPNDNAEQEIINLSKTKWQWMADKNVDKLAPLFHDKSKFVL